jgi:hypothetical protein
MLLGIDDGSHLDLVEHVWTAKATHVVLEPADESLVDVDGERYANAATYISVLPGASTLLC